MTKNHPDFEGCENYVKLKSLCEDFNLTLIVGNTNSRKLYIASRCSYDPSILILLKTLSKAQATYFPWKNLEKEVMSAIIDRTFGLEGDE